MLGPLRSVLAAIMSIISSSNVNILTHNDLCCFKYEMTLNPALFLDSFMVTFKVNSRQLAAKTASTNHIIFKQKLS